LNPTIQDSAAPCVLIVDDDPHVLHALETTALSAGHRVVATEDPLAGLQCLRDHSVSVIIADQRMDAMSGLELLDHAKRLQPHASRILITGMLSVKMLTEAVNDGEIYRFIAKPWSTPELITTVHNAVQRYHLLRENAALQAETLRLNEELLTEKRGLESRLAQAASDKTELERLLVSLRASRDGMFHFCEAVLTAFDGTLAIRTRRTVEICRQLRRPPACPRTCTTISSPPPGFTISDSSRSRAIPISKRPTKRRVPICATIRPSANVSCSPRVWAKWWPARCAPITRVSMEAVFPIGCADGRFRSSRAGSRPSPIS